MLREKEIISALEILLNSAAQKMPSILIQSLNKLIYGEKSKPFITSQHLGFQVMLLLLAENVNEKRMNY